MKTVYLFRHSTKTSTGNAPLSEEGIELAKNVGQTVLAGKHFTHFYTSPLSRTIDTLTYMAEGAGDFAKLQPEIFPPHQISQSPEGMSLWEGVCHTAEKAGKDMMAAALAEKPEKSALIAEESAKSFRSWLDTMPEHAEVLVIHHSPFLELMVHGLSGQIFPQLDYCEGFVIQAESENLTISSIETPKI